MRVLYRASKIEEAFAKGKAVYEQVGDLEFCCGMMRAWWGRLIGFGARDYPRSTDAEVNLYTMLQQANGKSVLVMARVAFCPWCGDFIEVRRKR